MTTLQTTGYLRLPSIIGDTKKGIVGVFPVSRSSWYDGVKLGKYPAPVRLGGGRAVAWRVEDIRELLNQQV